jgi:hypothetical protein
VYARCCRHLLQLYDSAPDDRHFLIEVRIAEIAGALRHMHLVPGATDDAIALLNDRRGETVAKKSAADRDVAATV